MTQSRMTWPKYLRNFRHFLPAPLPFLRHASNKGGGALPDGPKNVAKNTKGALKNNIHIQISGLTLHGIALNFAQTWPENLDWGGRGGRKRCSSLKHSPLRGGLCTFYKKKPPKKKNLLKFFLIQPAPTQKGC